MMPACSNPIMLKHCSSICREHCSSIAQAMPRARDERNVRTYVRTTSLLTFRENLLLSHAREKSCRHRHLKVAARVGTTKRSNRKATP